MGKTRRKKNNPTRLSCREARKLRADEKQAKEHYRKLGLAEIASDERDHERFLNKVLKRKKC